MALRDVKNFRFLKAALIYKHRYPKQEAFAYQGQKPIPFDPTIYKMAYNTFVQLGLRDYLNIQDPEVLGNFYKNVDRDPRLRFLNNPESFINDPSLQLPDSYYQEIAQNPDLNQVLAEPGIPTSAATRSFPNIRMPYIATPAAERTPTTETKTENQTPPTNTKAGFQIPKIPTTISSIGKNIRTNTSIGIKLGGNRVAKGLGSIFGGAAKGGGRLLIGAGGFSADALGRASNQISRGGAFKPPPKKYFAAIFGFIVFMALFVIFTSTGGPITAPGVLTPPGQTTSLAVSLTGPAGCIDDCQALNNQEITYEITLSYNGLGSADIAVSGQIPDKVYLSRADSENWSLSGSTFSQTILNLAANDNRKLPLTFKPNSDQEDFWTNHFVSVSANITKANLPGGTIGDSNIPPSDDTCAGKYTDQFKSNPSLGNKNFGDPTCTYSDDDLYNFLAIQDPDQAPFWWLLVDCESTYRPNIVNISAEDKTGAWGLFQMGRGKNGPLDHGDVSWIKQISNAIDYKNSLENGPAKYRFRGEESYWHCARPGGLRISANKAKPVK